MNSVNILVQEWANNPYIVLLSILFIIALVALLNWERVQIAWMEWRTRRCLNRIGIKQLRNVVCPDGLDGEFVLDRLVMLPNAILLISFKRYHGNIYCAERISEWTQVVEQKSFKFENPLFDLDHQLTTLRQLAPGTLFKGYLFFDHSAHFPKGHPPSVLHPNNIPEEYLRDNCTDPEQAVLKSWERLCDLPVKKGRNNLLDVKT